MDYDLVFVTHLPAFYKVNLYNRLAQQLRIAVIFIAPSSCIRNADFTQIDCQFNHFFLSAAAFEQRQQWSCLWQLYQLLRQLRYRKIILGGWDLIEFWALAFISPRAKNALALESSIHESSVTSLAAQLKKLFLSRISTVFSSGAPHQALLSALGYQGERKTTLGVGIANYQHLSQRSQTFRGKFLYVGRLASEKNIAILLKVFATLPNYQLTIIGDGPLRENIAATKTSNILLQGYVDNSALAAQYQAHDVFILPSIREPWGLVVEEALYYGLPVIASNRVGCAEDLLLRYEVGVLFSPDQAEELHQAIHWTVAHYAQLTAKLAALCFNTRDQYQVQQYLAALA